MDLQIPDQPAFHLSDREMQVLTLSEIADWLSVDTEQPLAADAYLLDGLVHWRFGPYQQGQFYVVSRDLGRYPVPSQGSVRFTGTDFAFHLLHENDHGEITSSPLLKVTVDKPLTWSRSSLD